MVNIDDLKTGDSFIYKTDKGNLVGFLLLEKETKSNKITKLKFALIILKDSAVLNIEDFKSGELLTHKVWNGLGGDFEIGVQCFDFELNGFYFLDKFDYVGNIDFVRTRFTIGGGGVFTNEMFLNLEMNNVEISNSKYERKPLSFIMK